LRRRPRAPTPVNGRRLEHQVPIDAVNRSDNKTCGEKTADHYFYRYRSNIPHASTTCRADSGSSTTANALYGQFFTVPKERFSECAAIKRWARNEYSIFGLMLVFKVEARNGRFVEGSGR
jgi:hypothetical protein